MARAIDKGATYLDKLCHKLYDEPKGCGKKTDYVCRLCGGLLETYYCEERLYLVKCADCGTLALVKTVNPEASASVTLARPTLAPPNEPLTLEQAKKEKYIWFEPMKEFGKVTQSGVLFFGTEAYMEWESLNADWGYRFQAYRRPPEGEVDGK